MAKAPSKKKAKRKDASKVLEPEVLPREESEEDDGPEGLLPMAKSVATPEVMEREPEVEVKDSLVPSDPLRRYLEELRRYPLLTPEKQHELAVQFRNTGDIKLAKALVTANLRLVVKIAME